LSGVGRVFRAMFAKDLRRELRSREIFISGFLFSIILLVAIYLAGAAEEIDPRRLGAGALWLSILFSGTIGLNRIHQSETADGCYRGLILAPVDGGWLFLAKVCTNLLLQGLSLALLLPLLALFFQVPLDGNPLALAASLGLGLAAFTAVGTLVVAITANTRMKDVLFPIIQLPRVVPILMAGVNSTASALAGETPSQWLQFLTAIDVVFLSAGFLLYEFLLEE
jgi:heme exporter protein B